MDYRTGAQRTTDHTLLPLTCNSVASKFKYFYVIYCLLGVTPILSSRSMELVTAGNLQSEQSQVYHLCMASNFKVCVSHSFLVSKWCLHHQAAFYAER